MKKLFLMVALACSLVSSGQTLIQANRVEVKDSLKVGAVTIGGISKDTSFASNSDQKLVTEKAVRGALLTKWSLGGNVTTAGFYSRLGTTGNTALRLTTNNVERLRIDSGGKVTISDFATASYTGNTLDIYGVTRFGLVGTAQYTQISTLATLRPQLLFNSNSAGDAWIENATNGVTFKVGTNLLNMALGSSGSVTPMSWGQLASTYGTTGSSNGWGFKTNGNFATAFSNTSADPNSEGFVFRGTITPFQLFKVATWDGNTGTSKFSIQNNGNVGIGDSTSASKLSVKGSGIFSDTLRAKTMGETSVGTDVATTEWVRTYESLHKAVTVNNYTPLAINVGNLSAKSLNVGFYTLTTDTTKVLASGYDAITTAAATQGGAQNLYAISTANKSRIRQAGAITKFQMYFNSKPADLTAFYFTVWRKNGTTFDRIGNEDELSKITGGTTNTITLTTPISVQEGDYIGWGYTASATVSPFLNGVTVTANSTTGIAEFTTTSAPSVSAFNWGTQTANAEYIPIRVYMAAPAIVNISNSILAGYPTHYPYTTADTINSQTTATPYIVQQILGLTGQNMGILGEQTNRIMARFNSDVVNAKPKFLTIEAGTNDVDSYDAYSVPTTQFVSSQTIVSNIIKMIDTAVVYNIKPVVLLILPETNRNNPKAAIADSINIALNSLINSHGGIVADARSLLGQNRSAPVLNLWDIKPTYTTDGIHLSTLGKSVLAGFLANIIAANIPSVGATFTNVGTIDSTGRITSNPLSGTGNRPLFATSTGVITAGYNVYNDYADNAAAIAAGLTSGMFYRTGDLLKQVH